MMIDIHEKKMLAPVEEALRRQGFGEILIEEIVSLLSDPDRFKAHLHIDYDLDYGIDFGLGFRKGLYETQYKYIRAGILTYRSGASDQSVDPKELARYVYEHDLYLKWEEENGLTDVGVKALTIAKPKD